MWVDVEAAHTVGFLKAVLLAAGTVTNTLPALASSRFPVSDAADSCSCLPVLVPSFFFSSRGKKS